MRHIPTVIDLSSVIPSGGLPGAGCPDKVTRIDNHWEYHMAYIYSFTLHLYEVTIVNIYSTVIPWHNRDNTLCKRKLTSRSVVYIPCILNLESLGLGLDLDLIKQRWSWNWYMSSNAKWEPALPEMKMRYGRKRKMCGWGWWIELFSFWLIRDCCP